jgi:hypothetical protein
MLFAEFSGATIIILDLQWNWYFKSSRSTDCACLRLNYCFLTLPAESQQNMLLVLMKLTQNVCIILCAFCTGYFFTDSRIFGWIIASKFNISWMVCVTPLLQGNISYVVLETYYNMEL